MQKGNTYGKQVFKTPQQKEKNLNEVAEDYYNLCTIPRYSRGHYKGLQISFKVL